MTHCGHGAGRNPALQSIPNLILANAVCCPRRPWLGQQMHFDPMRRREFIALLGGAAAWPLAARAQQGGGMRRIGVLVASYAETDREGQARVAVFLDTFRRLGWSDGRNVRIDYHWGAGDADRSTAFAAELVRSAPDVIVAVSNPTLAELQRLTRTI